MKKITFTCLILLQTCVVWAQKIITKPQFNATDVAYLSIEKIVVSDTTTELHFSSVLGMKFRIDSKSYILEDAHGEKLMLKWSKGIKLNKFFTVNEANRAFVLAFPAIKKSTARIDYLEGDCEGCFKILEIALHKPAMKLLNETFRGNWFKTDGSKEWVLGLYDSIAVYKSQVWKYTFSSKKDKKAIINLKRESESQTLNLEALGMNGNFKISSGNGEVATVSKNSNGQLHAKFEPGFPAPLIKADSAIYRGFIGAYSPRLGFKTGQIIVNNIITGDQDSYLLEIKPDGSFFAKFPLYYPQVVYIDIANDFKALYFEPGKELFHFSDQANVERSQQFMGDCALINEELVKLESALPSADSRKSLADFNGLTAEQYRTYLLNVRNNQLDLLEKYKQTSGLSQKAFTFYTRKIDSRTVSDIFDFNNNVEAAYRRANKVADTVRRDFVKDVTLDSNYYKPLQQLSFRDELAITNAQYFSLLNRLRYSFVPTGKKYKLVKGAIDVLRASGVTLSPAEEKIAKSLIDRDNSSDTVLAENGRELDKEAGKLFSKYSEELEMYFTLAYRDIFNEGLDAALGIKNTLVADLLYAQDYVGRANKKLIPLSDDEFSQLAKRISNPLVVESCKRINDDIKAKVEANKKNATLVNEVPKTSSDKLFASIMEKYKGKVVYVDFWATWCGPCLSGIKKIAPLKEEMKDDNVVFVYITNQTSPLASYHNMIGGIKGEHYRVSSDEWKYLCTKFNIVGIPHCILVDTEGKVADPHLPHLENNGIKTRITALQKAR